LYRTQGLRQNVRPCGRDVEFVKAQRDPDVRVCRSQDRVFVRRRKHAAGSIHQPAHKLDQGNPQWIPLSRFFSL
jgi:hypothetical protein